MPPKVKQQDTSPNLPGAGINPFPGDSGNPLAPANPNPTAPTSGVATTTDFTGTTYNSIPVTVGGVPVNLQLNQDISATDPVGLVSHAQGGTQAAPTVQQRLNEISTWSQNATEKARIVAEMYSAGLVTSKKSPSAGEIARAWQLLVQEAALNTADLKSAPDMRTPDGVLAKAAQGGWNAIGAKQVVNDTGLAASGNINGSTDTTNQSETVYKSYVDPATAMGALADAYYRLMGRNPNSGEYQAFLSSIKGYQDEVNTGKDTTTNKGPLTGSVDPNTGLPVDQSGTTGGSTTTGTSTQTNVVSQRGIGQRGVEFLAGQAAMANPEEAQYQAATTVFSAIIKALGAPGAAGESGPTTSAP